LTAGAGIASSEVESIHTASAESGVHCARRTRYAAGRAGRSIEVIASGALGALRGVADGAGPSAPNARCIGGAKPIAQIAGSAVGARGAGDAVADRCVAGHTGSAIQIVVLDAGEAGR